MLVVYFFLGKNSINVNAIHNLQFWNWTSAMQVLGRNKMDDQQIN
jgi:hypothetical protein